MLQVINPAPLNSTNSAANTAYSGPAYWEGNGGQVFFRGRRTSRTGATLFRQPLPHTPPTQIETAEYILRSSYACAVCTSATAITHMLRLGECSSRGSGTRPCERMCLRGDLLKENMVGCRYGFDGAGKLPAQPSVQAQDLVGVFNNRASNPVVQAAAKDATEAILWEVSLAALLYCCKGRTAAIMSG